MLARVLCWVLVFLLVVTGLRVLLSTDGVPDLVSVLRHWSEWKDGETWFNFYRHFSDHLKYEYYAYINMTNVFASVDGNVVMYEVISTQLETDGVDDLWQAHIATNVLDMVRQWQRDHTDYEFVETLDLLSGTVYVYQYTRHLGALNTTISVLSTILELILAFLEGLVSMALYSVYIAIFVIKEAFWLIGVWG